MFDAALLESGPGRRVRIPRAGLPLAVGAHLLVIGAFVGAAAWTVGDPAEPEERIRVFPAFTEHVTATPPGGGGPTGGAPPPRSRVLPSSFALPSDPPAPGQEAPPPGPEGPPGESTGPGPGLGPGEGPGEGPGIGEGDPGEPDTIFRPGGDVVAPMLLTRVEPAYPEAARRARLEGTLILEAVITAAGDVRDVRVLKSVNPLLDAAAEQAVRQWKYRPATRDGRAVPVYLTVTVRFGLRN